MDASPEVDVVVVGAGFAGLYATHRLRNLMGLEVRSFEKGSGPGGTWYWNRYPGARCDFESVHYSYSFDEDLQREWRWSERFSAQPEILRYLEHVADRFDLRRSYAFDTRITSMTWDDDADLWRVATDTGEAVTARFVVSGAGNVAIPKANEFPGEETFRGEVHRTSSWPHDGVDLEGRRVGVVGTGSTGLQVVPAVVDAASHLTVFQRTASFACPLGNGPNDPDEWDATVERYPELRRASRQNFLGAPYPPAAPSAMAASEAERRRVYDEFYDGGGFRMVGSTFGDLLFDKAANDTAADYIRDRIRDRVEDPEVAELLCPDDHPYATKRAPFETGYFEVFNRDDVTLVDVRSAPIEAITPTGIRTADGEYELDVIVLATGFDAFTGTLLRMGIVGRDGRTLAEHWADGPRTYLGIAMEGFPNLFTITGPQSAVALYNNPLAIEDHVEFAADAIAAVRARGATTIEPTADAEAAWKVLVDGIADRTLLPLANSWYMGANIPGKPRSVLFYAAGAPMYRAVCAEVEATGYGGFAIDGDAVQPPPSVTLDPAVELVVAAMLMQGAKPLEDCTLEETRATLESFRGLQLPARGSVAVTETTYPSAGGDRPVRIYAPDGGDADEPRPVVLFLHPGGWCAGSIDVAHEPCCTLADDLGAIVVSPSYRLAPEHPFPAAPDDAYAALCWTAESIADHGGDPARIAVAGESSGGNLAAATALRARDEGGPELVAQVLIYPPIDPDAATPSRERFAAGPVLSAAAVDGMWATYLGDPANRESPYASPARAASLEGLPPALVLTVEADLTRDEAEDYARALEAAGVPTTAVRVDGLVHASLNMSAHVPRTRELYDAVESFLVPRLGARAPSAGAAAD